MTLAAERYGVRATNDFLPDAERDEEGGEYPLLYMRK